jgi:dolichol-phosphate mannosyltransferase
MPPAEERRLDRGLVTILVPAKNEEAGIGPTLDALPRATLAAMGFRSEVLVLDGNSRDRTRAIARARGATVIEQTLPGKGTALRLARPRVGGDYVVMLDADHTYAEDAIPALLAALADDGADVVLGSRRKGWVAPGAMGPVNRFGNLALSLLASALYARRCSDVCTGMWGFRGHAFHALHIEASGFELEVELFGRSARAGFRIAEVPVDYLPRRGGTKLSRARDGLRIAWWLIRTRFQRPRSGTAPSGYPGPGGVAR